MSQKVIKITRIVLTVIVSLVFLGSAFGKLTGDASTVQMAGTWGINSANLKYIGVIELLAVVLFAISRTGLLGTLLLVAYMGGAIATHLEHKLPILAPIIISSFVWITAVVRFPELTWRLLGKKQEDLNKK